MVKNFVMFFIIPMTPIKPGQNIIIIIPAKAKWIAMNEVNR